MRRSFSDVIEIDEIDRHLIERLKAHPHVSHVTRAAEIGVTDETVASRLRALRDGAVLAVTALVDFEAAGFGVHAYARLAVPNRPPIEVVKPLLDLDAAHLVASTSGCCDAIVSILAPDVESLRHSVV